MNSNLPHLLVTPGEPAGVGPELLLRIAGQAWPACLTAIADRNWLQQLIQHLQLPITLVEAETTGYVRHQAGVLPVQHVPMAVPAELGQLNTANARYVLDCLDVAVDWCASHDHTALVTGPVHKGIINDAGIAFTGHTEYLAQRLNVDQVVMLLADNSLRVALVTTHLPLRQVAEAVTSERLQHCIDIIHRDLQHRFGLQQPRIMVLGLNPHAGEQGHLGIEEQTIIEPLLAQLSSQGILVSGPIPADTAFSATRLADCDVVLAMYHDQGLTPLKAQSFGRIANITLGLPIIRTSVDHGTALDLADLPVGTAIQQRANTDSLIFACQQALIMCQSANG